MSDKLLVKRPLYPLLGIVSAILIMVFGLITAKNARCILFLGAVWTLFLAFGYLRACLATLPVAAVMCATLAGITYAISRDVSSALAAVNRILAVCIAVIPGLALPPALLVRNLNALRLPRVLTLGMMITLSFFPLLGSEARRVREAMRARGAGSLLSPHIFYRSFLIPFIMRLVNISDTLALSVETRGFTKDRADCTVYKTVRPRPADGIFLALLIAGIVWVTL